MLLMEVSSPYIDPSLPTLTSPYEGALSRCACIPYCTERLIGPFRGIVSKIKCILSVGTLEAS